MRRYVLDANALLTLVAGRPGSKRVDQMVQEAARTGMLLQMSAVNWGEVVYSMRKARSEAEADALARSVEQLPVNIVPVDRDRARRAGELKAMHGLGYADCFAASLALELRATLITADPDFRKVGSKLKVEFLPRHQATSSS
ncbi:MAG TPA: type II toxin-antitoxin system VapC family toxin [Candidatus Udaeobacter sp.]|nr:type II toxin-antitoxin system VapC family toxin [Candidatus Udaeobacter sp.]